MNEVKSITFGELKKIVEQLDNQQLAEDTQVFLDTGWDSLQEIGKDSFKKVQAVPFQIQDELTKEYYGGYVREEKKDTKDVVGAVEEVIVIEHFY